MTIQVPRSFYNLQPCTHQVRYIGNREGEQWWSGEGGQDWSGMLEFGHAEGICVHECGARIHGRRPVKNVVLIVEFDMAHRCTIHFSYL